MTMRYMQCPPDPRIEGARPFWKCMKKGCNVITYSQVEAAAHLTEAHLPKRKPRKRREKPFSRFARVMGMDQGDYKP